MLADSGNRRKIRNASRFTITTVAPAGEDRKNERDMPRRKHTTERTAEQITTLWKVWQRRIEVSAGKISRLEIKRAHHAHAEDGGDGG